MALLEGFNQQQYYEGDIHGSYQFVSLKDIVNQFIVAYVGENKLIPKVRKIDVLFHAQRALQELSFDTITSFKSQEIEIPPSLIMALPHDYVNYTKVSTVDSSGIKHPLYPTKHTSNPFEIKQEANGDYNFTNITSITGILSNADFELTPLTNSWQVTRMSSILNDFHSSGLNIEDGKLKTAMHTHPGGGGYNNTRVQTAYQAIDVSNIDYLDISAEGTADTVIISAPATHVSGGATVTNVTNTTPNQGVLRVGISSTEPDPSVLDRRNNMGAGAPPPSPNIFPALFDLQTTSGDVSYTEWLGPTAVGSTTGTQEVLNIDVRSQTTVYAIIVSFANTSDEATASFSKGKGIPAFKMNSVDNVIVTAHDETSHGLISPVTNGKNVSTTWNSYKSHTDSENTVNDYQDYENNVYWPNEGERYGLEPSHAQINGSYYIDQLRGNIHFSSILNGKTIILDYISDGLGTEEEMRVHKFAEEAMYKSIAYAVLSTSSYGQQLVPRFRKEKFAETRKAKLRLSNFKLEELTQILRGKSKQIKH